MAPPRRRSRGRRELSPVFPVLIAFGVVGLLAALIGVGNGSTSPGTAATTTTVATTTTLPPVPVPAEALRDAVGPDADGVPTAYRIEYDIVEGDTSRQEVWTVRRPYEAVIVSTRDGEVVSGAATSRSDLWTYLGDSGGWVSLQGQVHRAVSDPRPVATMSAMVALGLAEEVGSGEYVGRPCRVFITGQPISAGDVTAPSEDEITELCIDETGLVLAERWVRSGDVLIDRQATAVTLDPPLADSTFDPEPRAELTPELELILGDAAPSAPASDAEVAALRSAVVVPDGFALDEAVTRSDAAATAVIRYYRAGPELIEVAEWSTTDVVVLADGGFRPVAGAERDDVWFRADLRAAAIRVGVDDRTFVEVTGTDPAALLAMAESLTVDG